MVVDAKAGSGGDQCVLLTVLVNQCIEAVNNELWQFFNLFPNFDATGAIDEATNYAEVVGTMATSASARGATWAFGPTADGVAAALWQTASRRPIGRASVAAIAQGMAMRLVLACRPWVLVAPAAVALAGCPSDTGDGNPFATGGMTTAPMTSGSSGVATTASTEQVDETGASGSDEADTGIKLDVGPSDLGDTKQDFCNFVDILFVIDNSLSMNEYQTQLALAWPTFVDEMWANLPEGTDLHVGMTTTSFWDGSCSEGVFNCVTTASDGAIDAHYMTPQEGSTGVNGEQGRLFEWDGQRYFEATVGEDSGDLKLWFSQAAVAAGETGCSYEMMSAAAGYALHPANAEFNEGFLRDEGAVLAIIVLTDEPDKSPEGASTYYDMVVEAKAGCGGDQCVLVTGLVDQCIEGVNNELWQFFNMFPNFNTTGSIEEPADYASVVGTALAEVIGETCDQIPPAG